MDFLIFEAHLVASVMATEIPPQQPPDGPPFTPRMRELAQRAIASVIRNRVALPGFPDTAAEVVLQRKAFSAVWLSQVRGQDYWIRACAGRWFPAHVASCLQAWSDRGPDITDGCTHYYSPIHMEPPGREPDWWQQLEEVEIEGLTGPYYRFGRRKRG